MSAEIVPAADTVAVNAAATGLVLSTINPPRGDAEGTTSYANKSALSRNTSLSVVEKLPIIFAVGNINDSKVSLDLWII